MIELLTELGGLDWSRLIKEQPNPFVDIERRADARMARWKPITVEDRLEAYKRMGFRPHGLFVPGDDENRARLMRAVKKLGLIKDAEERLRLYHKLQDHTATWEASGVAGAWTGQQAVTRSRARFRIDARGRRGGKSFLASREAMAVALIRPRAWIWVAAPTMKLVSRVFDMLEEMIADLGVRCTINRNTMQEKLIVLENGSKIEGVSLDNILSAAGASVDYAIVDEAAQLPQEAWTRAIMPPLADRNGQALLISSWEGEGNFFYQLAEDAKKEMISHKQAGDDRAPLWEMFTGASWDNFYAFPQGRETETIKEAEKNTPPIDFLEQYGAVAAKNREKVYPEFKESVHCGDYPFNPEMPVHLIVDPSNGVNPYAVLAVQDYGDFFVAIDEFYRSGMITEKISPVLKQKPWFPNVTEGVLMDSANESEIMRWVSLGWNAFAVDKPEVADRIPYVRNQLRDPLRYYEIYMRKVGEIMAERGKTREDYFDLPEEQQQIVAIMVEERLADESLTDADIEDLKGCAHFRVNAKTCPNLVEEFRRYSYPKLRGLRDQNYKEAPKKYYDHLMDCLGYFCWTYKRYDGEVDLAPRPFVYPQSLSEELGPTQPHVPMQGWLSVVRNEFDLKLATAISYLKSR